MVVCGNQEEKDDRLTRATTLSSPIIRILLSIAARYDMELRQIDIVNAFVNADLDRPVYMWPPPGYRRRHEHNNRIVWALDKALYGLRQSPRLWQLHISKKLADLYHCQINISGTEQ